MNPSRLLLLLVCFASPALARDVTEPRSGATFVEARDGQSLLGVGLRTKTLLKVKVYAIGLYVSDAALSGPLATYRGKPASAALYRDLVWGDFPKHIVLHIVRDLTADQVREAFRERLAHSADKANVERLAGYLGETKTGQELVFRWAPGGVLEVSITGVAKPPIASKDFAAAVFSIWLGEHPVQEDIKADLVSRLVSPAP